MNWITSWFAPKEEEQNDPDLKTAIENYKFASEDAKKLSKISREKSSELLKISEQALHILDKIEKK